MKECDTKKLLIPLTNVSIKANTINFNLKRLQQYRQRQLFVLCNNYLKVHSQIQNLKTCQLRKNSLGYDEISTLLFKCSVAFISSPIYYICIIVLLT